MTIKEEHKQVLREAVADNFRGHFELRVSSTAAWASFTGIPLFSDDVEYRYVPYKDPTPVPFDFQSFTNRVHAHALIYVRHKNAKKCYHLVTGFFDDGLMFVSRFYSWNELACHFEWTDSAGLGAFSSLEWKPFTR